jgi:hypothetical protein
MGSSRSMVDQRSDQTILGRRVVGQTGTSMMLKTHWPRGPAVRHDGQTETSATGRGQMGRSLKVFP